MSATVTELVKDSQHIEGRVRAAGASRDGEGRVQPEDSGGRLYAAEHAKVESIDRGESVA